MANPQPDIFVRYSKELYDAILRSPLPPVHYRVVEAVIRRTYGDHGKKTAPISLSLFMAMTGKLDKNIRIALKELCEEGVLIKHSEATRSGQPAVYGLNKNYECWGKWSVTTSGLTDQTTSGLTDQTSPVSQTRGGPVSQTTIEDKRETRETKPKHPPTPLASKIADAKAFDSFWETYPVKTGKGAARTAWDKALKKVDSATILAGLALHLPVWSTQELRFIPAPKKWLEEERWSDTPTNGNGTGKYDERAGRIRQAIAAFEKWGEPGVRGWTDSEDEYTEAMEAVRGQ